jgi:hypothetical protein
VSAEGKALEQFFQLEGVLEGVVITRSQIIARTTVSIVNFITWIDIARTASFGGEQPFEASAEGKLERTAVIAAEVPALTARVASGFIARRTGNNAVARTALTGIRAGAAVSHQTLKTCKQVN